MEELSEITRYGLFMNDRLHILVVDDDKNVLEIFREYFERATDAYSLVTARNGAEAIEICGKRKIDFCFTDLYMPQVDGIEFVNRLHELDNTIPVVVMTGYPTTDNAIATLKGGVVDFLKKPFRGDDIGKVIDGALANRSKFVSTLFSKEEKSSRERLLYLDEKLSEKTNDLNMLNLILQKLEWVKSSSEFFDLVVGLCAQVSGSDEAHFHVFDESTGKTALVASFQKAKSECNTDNQWAIEKAALKGVSEGTAFLMKDCVDSDCLGLPLRSVIGIPLRIRGKIFGIITVALIGEGKEAFSEKQVYYLDFVAKRAAFLIENLALYENIYENLFATLYAFVEAIEAKDPYTKQHSNRVAELSVIIGSEMGLSGESLDLLNFSGHLHDIGKIGIRDHILLKPARLTAEEYTAIKEHPIIGASIIGHLGLMSEEQTIVRHHHERWDGRGYPDGLRGTDIPFLSRILAVADTYDAMASDRAYRKRIPKDIILQMIEGNSEKQFDPRVVTAFMRAHQKGNVSQKDTANPFTCKKCRLINIKSDPFDGCSLNPAN